MGKRLLVIILFAVAVWVPGYLVRDLWEPDEARYAYVAQEMQAGNHWFVPHRHGDFYAHKPPLMFWLINAGSFLTKGKIGPLATRLPSLLGVILMLWSVSTIAELWTNRQAAWRTMFIAATTQALWWRAGWGQIDMLLCGLQMSGLCLLFLDDVRRTLWRPLLAFCCFGLAIHAKGPVGFLVPVGAYLASNLAAGTARNLRRWHWLWALPVVLLWPAAWLLLAKASGASEAYFQELLFKLNASRAAGGMGHIRPFYYYLEYLLVDGLPWILVLPFSIWALAKQPGKARVVLRRALGWAGFVVLFFTLFPTKRGLYILLAYPALAVIVGAAWVHLVKLPRPARWTTAGLLAAVPGAIGIALLCTKWIPDVPIPPVSALAGGGPLLVGTIVLILCFLRMDLSRQWLAMAISLVLVTYLFTAIIILPQFNAMKTPHKLVPEVQKRLQEDEALLLYKINAEILPYYCERRGEVHWVAPSLNRAMRRQKRGMVVFLEPVWNDLEAAYGEFGETGRFTMGHKSFVWLAFSL